MMNNNDNQMMNENESFNIRAEIEKYVAHWKWFVVSVVLCASLAVFYAKSMVNIYQTKTSILVKQDDKAASELRAFQDLSSSIGIGGSNKNVIDEVEILKSKTLSEACAKKIDLNYLVYEDKGFKTVELYDNRPFKLQVLSDKEKFHSLDTVFKIKVLDGFNYEMINVEDGSIIETKKFGEKVTIKNNELIFTPSDNFLQKGKFYTLYFRSVSRIVEKLQGSIKVTVGKDSNIIKIALNHPLKDKAQDILDTLVNLYNQMSIEDKNLVGKKTGDFIAQRLEVIKNDLDEVDRLEEMYKSDKEITDISTQSSLFINAKSQNELEKFNSETKLRLTEFMLEDIQNQKEDFELLPTNIGSESYPQLSLDVTKYNTLLFERNRLLRASSISNPVVKNLNLELIGILTNITTSLKNIKKQLEISIASLNSMEKEFEDRISSLPKQVREYRSILRRQSIIAELYSYLLQKQEENEISMAVTVSNAKVIDRAYSLKDAVAPRKLVIALIGLIIGFVLPFSIIYIRDILDTKFYTKKDVEQSVSSPILGDIPLDKSEEKVVVKKGSRTSAAEAFRLLRTNLDFMLTSVDGKSKSIFVTSTVSGEGKTFVSVNTAASIALTGKKVLLVGLDLRAPKITQYLGLPNKKGVTNYILDDQLNLPDLIISLDGHDNLDLLSSGIIPPNPAELLLSPRISEMLDELKSLYDYIIIDTAPVNLVTDTLMLSQHADMFLYVSRANYLDKRLLEVPERLYKEKRLPNLALLINGVDYTRGYGYGSYGYGYGNQGGYVSEGHKTNFLKKIFGKS